MEEEKRKIDKEECKRRELEDNTEIDHKLLKRIEAGEIEAPEQTGGEMAFFPSNKYIIHPEDGLIFVDKLQISKQRKVLFYLLKKLGSSLFKGGNPLNISLPIYIYDNRSYLQILSESYTYCPYFMEKARDAESALEKIKYICAWGIGTLHKDIFQLEPYIPFQCETYQAVLGEYEMCLEQLSQKPPISYIHIDGPKFRVYGSVEMKPKLYPNSAKVFRIGDANIELKDSFKTTYRLSYPILYLDGIMFGRRLQVYLDQMLIEDLTNNLIADIRFNPQPNTPFLKGIFSKPKPKPRKDYFEGIITTNNKFTKEKNFMKMMRSLNTPDISYVLSNLNGHWTSHVSIENEIFWDIKEQISTEIFPKPLHISLPYDSRHREDLIARSNPRYSQEFMLTQKEKLEGRGKIDKKLRRLGEKMRGRKQNRQVGGSRIR